MQVNLYQTIATVNCVEIVDEDGIGGVFFTLITDHRVLTARIEVLYLRRVFIYRPYGQVQYIY